MIIECLFSTLDEAGGPNFAPMGVTWGEEVLVVRPFRETHTCRNLLRTGYGVATLTDDATALVKSALSDELLPHFPAEVVPGVVYAGACTWRELAVVNVGGGERRAEIRCRIVGVGRRREFLGFNRARNALVEGAILATRLHITGRDKVLDALDGLEVIVGKTGDEAERTGMRYLREWVRSQSDASHG